MGLFPGSSFVKLLPDCTDGTLRTYFEELTSAYQNWNGVVGVSVDYWAAAQALRTQEVSEGYVGIDDMASACQAALMRRNCLAFHCKVERDKKWEEWLIYPFLTPIPHVDGLLIKTFPRREKQLPRTEMGFLEYLLRHELADVVMLDPEAAEKGNVCSLYLVHQIEAIRSFRRAYKRKKSHGRKSIISDFFEKAKTVLSPPEMALPLVELSQDRKTVSEFVRKCNHQLLSVWGERRFEDYLKDTSISLKRWLKA